MKQTLSKAKTEDNTNSVVKNKFASKFFTANNQTKALRDQPQHRQHLQTLTALGVQVTTASGSVGFLKKTTQRAKVVAEAKLLMFEGKAYVQAMPES